MKFQATLVPMHHQYATTQDFLPPINDVILADYDVSPSCRFSHGTALQLPIFSYVESSTSYRRNSADGRSRASER